MNLFLNRIKKWSEQFIIYNFYKYGITEDFNLNFTKVR